MILSLSLSFLSHFLHSLDHLVVIDKVTLRTRLYVSSSTGEEGWERKKERKKERKRVRNKTNVTMENDTGKGRRK